MMEIFEGVYSKNRKLYTKNLAPGKAVYGERLIHENGVEYREWSIYRSKLASAITCGLETWPFNKNSLVLYLGASTGTTVSHVSDIVESGAVFAVEISPYVGKRLIQLAETRPNVLPIIEDAEKPDKYPKIPEVDILYEDVANPFQAEIFNKNANLFLKNGGVGFIAIKSQSIDVTKEPDEIFKRVKRELKNVKILEEIDISKYHKDHMMLVVKKH